jgi:8-oxo-dGTP pyrophosphatase MutT (NUDIX family)
MARKSPDKQRRSATAAVAGPGHPPSLQVGALCWRRAKSGAIRILLATSRDTGRWVIPKGWPMRKRTEPEAAAREAYEEAGVQGEIDGRSVGLFTYEKGLGRGRKLNCVVKVFAL